MQLAEKALALARVNAGSSIAARMAMIAITTSSSIRVNPPREWAVSLLDLFRGFMRRL